MKTNIVTIKKYFYSCVNNGVKGYIKKRIIDFTLTTQSSNKNFLHF